MIGPIDLRDRSGRPLFFQFCDLQFLWNFRREEVVAPTVPDQRSG